MNQATVSSEEVPTTIQLRQGIHQFIPDEFGTVVELREALRAGLRRLLLVTCSDQGVAPDHLSICDAEQCITLQNLAAGVPHSTATDDGSVIGSLRYALADERVRDIVICSHFGCGILRHWLDAGVGMKASRRAEAAPEACRIVRDHYGGALSDERFRFAVCEHALVQLSNLRSHAFIRDRLQSGHLRLHGWIIDDETAKIVAYDPVHHQFVSPEHPRHSGVQG